MAEQTTENTLDFKKLVPVLVVVLVDVLGLTILIPILPYYSITFGADAFTIGLIAAAYPAMQFMFVPILGSLSDRIGRKPVLATAQMGTFISLMILGFSSALWMIFLSRILDGITGANFATAQSVITDSTDEENRAKGLGLIGATFGVGFIFGPVLSGLALWVSGNNYSAPAFLAAGFAFVSFLLTTFMLEETNPPENRAKPTESRQRNFRRMGQFMIHPTLGILFLFVFLNQVVFGMFQITFAPFTLNKLGLNSLGNVIFFTAFGVVSAVMQGGFAGPLNKRFGERKLVFAG
ncbi:MAG: MFS transporter, partial [Anaerolineae bacterium]